MFMGIPLEELSLITVHLGNGASMAAIKYGKCIDTSMGLTPLEGLVMGTRSGDIDPALPFFLSRHMGMQFEDIDRLLNEDSGLKGLCGANDMREVMEKRDAGDRKAAVAMELYCYRVKKYIGAYFAALGSLDAVIFTAGIGENSPLIREMCCSNMSCMGIDVDPAKNYRYSDKIRDISQKDSMVSILVVPTNEELVEEPVPSEIEKV
jgi:acetate kinase